MIRSTGEVVINLSGRVQVEASNFLLIIMSRGYRLFNCNCSGLLLGLIFSATQLLSVPDQDLGSEQVLWLLYLEHFNCPDVEPPWWAVA